MVENMDKIKELNECLELLYKNHYDLNADLLLKVANEVLRIEGIDNLTKVELNNNIKNVAEFVPKYNTIYYSMSKIPSCLYDNDNIYYIMDNFTEVGLLNAYLLLLIFLHESEHASAYLMGNELIKSPSALITYSYKTLNDLLIKEDHKIPRPIKDIKRYYSLSLYLKNNEKYLLERNANLEAYSVMAAVAYYRKEKEIASHLLDLSYSYMNLGYLDSNEGSILETLKELKLDKKKPDVIDYEELDTPIKLHYGLPITNEERKHLISLK